MVPKSIVEDEQPYLPATNRLDGRIGSPLPLSHEDAVDQRFEVDRSVSKHYDIGRVSQDDARLFAHALNEAVEVRIMRTGS